MNPAQRDSHPPDRQRNWVASREYSAVRNTYDCAQIDPQRLQPLRLFHDKPRPINRCNTRAGFKRKKIECHAELALP